ncbi:cytidylate kinase-like family protein [Desulfobacula sp.]|uniref:cytidylate kinase-like family protein n=1 Tax=Desulfobacula sp. TaxID=2593537 RepID=UPI0026347EEE|nr:cytidylate kinase-like family protein [Desulfobacula sp.]
MAIITISRGSYSMGKAVAEKVAEKLEYCILSRDLLINASASFHIPQKKLEKAIHDAPGVFEQYSHTKEVYLAYIRSTLTEMVAGGNIVYHGLAGHLLLNRLPHVLKVRITANLESRIARKMKEGFSEHKARTMIIEDDGQRTKWTQKIYHADPNDSSLYDMVICIDKLSIEDAVSFICQSASKKTFESTSDRIRQAKDLSLACKAKASMIESFPEVGITCEYGNLLVYASEKEAHMAKFKKILDAFQKENVGIHNLEVHTGLPVPANAV